MSGLNLQVRQVVAWIQPIRWTTCAMMWAALVVLWTLPHLDLSLRGIWPLGFVAAMGRTGVVLTAHRRHVAHAVLAGAALTAEAVLLTGLLDITGGPYNPFIVIYAVYVWVAAATVSLAWAIVVTAASLAGFGWLVADHLQAGLAEHHRLNDFPTHLFTMWFAGAGVAELVAHYVAQARAALALRQLQVDEARIRAERNERLASLTTLAAGAAHELSTPLATIAVAARELERSAARIAEPSAVAAALREDARLIRSELDRCQSILDGMSGRARDGGPPGLEPLSPASIVNLVLERLPESRRERVSVEIVPHTPNPCATGAEMVQAISSLLKNAFDASTDSDRVLIRFAEHGGMVRIEVHDRGAGMSLEAKRRAGEPFYTTKEPGRGLGLGLFLVRTLAERSGGSLEFAAGAGTTAVLEVPVFRSDVSLA